MRGRRGIPAWFLLAEAVWLVSVGCSSQADREGSQGDPGTVEADGSSGFGGGTVFSGGEGAGDSPDTLADASGGGGGNHDDAWGRRAQADAAIVGDADHVGLGDEPDLECGYGTLLGLVCSPNEQIFVNGAKVWIDTLDCDGHPLLLQTYSNTDGAYAFVGNVPSGYHDVHIESGGWTKTQLAFIKAGKVSDVSGVAYKQCYQVKKACEVGNIQGAVCIGEGQALPSAAEVWVQAPDCNQVAVMVKAQSDPMGQFLLQQVPVGPAQVFVSWAGKLLSYSAEVKPGLTTVLSPATDPICFPDDGCKSGAISGQVCVPSGQAWSVGTPVSVTAKDCNGQTQTLKATTNAEGKFWIAGVPEGLQWVVIEHPGAAFQVSATVTAGGVANVGLVGAKTCTPETCPKGTILGTVCPNPQGSPAAGALAYTNSIDCNGQLTYVTAQVNASGQFTLQGVPAGPTWVFVQWGSHLFQEQVIVAANGTVQSPAVGPALCAPQGACQTGGAAGLVCKPTGDGWVNGAAVSVKTADCQGKPVELSTTTNASGAFNLQGIPTGLQWITVAFGQSGYQLQVQVQANQTTQLGTVGAPICDPNPCSFGNIQGTICTEGGIPVGGSAKAWVSPLDCKGVQKKVEVVSGPGGTYLLQGVPTGQVWLFLEWQGQTKQIQVNVQANQTAVIPMWQDGVCFPAPACGVGAITGKLCKPDGTAWIPGAAISLNSVDCHGKPIAASTNTDANGVFWLTGISEGNHWLLVQPQGSAAFQQPVTVLAGGTADLGVVGAPSCNPGGQCGFGSISGWICSPSGVKVPGGQVLVKGKDCQGNPVALQASVSATGDFSVAGVPAGTVTVEVSKGNYSTTYAVQVAPNQNTHVPNSVPNFCFPANQVKLAVVGGNWDQIEQILSSLGLAYDFYDSTTSAAGVLLNDIGLMSTYDVIFFNCGAAHSALIQSLPSISSNLAMYVQAGGSTYASDWAYLYAELPWPNAIDFVGNDANGSDPKVGNAQTLTGVVVDPLLGGYLGKSNVKIEFNLGGWVVMLSAAANTKVHVQGWVDVAGAQVPLLVSHTPYGGSGRVLFTSFHNKPQVGADIEKILKFLVFEL